MKVIKQLNKCCLVVLIFMFLLSSCKTEILRSDNLDLYINDNFESISNYDIYKRTSNNCKSYFPKYENFEYKEFVYGFYVFDGSSTLLQTSISFVLELRFLDAIAYENFYDYEINRVDYNDDFIVEYKDYSCLITDEDNFTFCYYDQHIPFQFGMLCMNKNKLSARYVYFRECESQVDKHFNIVFENTNCDW